MDDEAKHLEDQQKEKMEIEPNVELAVFFPRTSLDSGLVPSIYVHVGITRLEGKKLRERCREGQKRPIPLFDPMSNSKC